MCGTWNSYSYMDVFDVNIENKTYSLRTTINSEQWASNVSAFKFNVSTVIIRITNSGYYTLSGTYTLVGSPNQAYTISNIAPEGSDSLNSNYLKWQMCPTQFTLTQPGSLYEGEVAFGKTGTVVGTLGADPSNTFDDAAANICVKAQDAYDNMTPLVATDSDKTAGLGKNIVLIPSKRDGTPLLDTSNLTSAYSMFNSCEKLVSVATLNIHNATSTEQMFYRCLSLLAIPQLDTSNSTNMRQMFYNCSSLTTLPLLDTGSVTNMAEMCNGCTGLITIPLLDTSHVTKMNYTFGSCTNLLSVPLLDTSAATDLRYTFSNCPSLVSVPILNTSNATDMDDMFRACSSLSDTSLNNILAMCTNANSYTGAKTLKHIGLSSEQATRCQSLSNYTAFTNAGWTTGY